MSFNFDEHQKNNRKTCNCNSEKMGLSPDDLFDVTHANIMSMITIQKTSFLLMRERKTWLYLI